MAAPIFWREFFFCQQSFIFETRQEKRSQELYQENRLDVLENSHPVLSKMMSHFHLVTNKYHRYPSSVDVFDRI